MASEYSPKYIHNETWKRITSTIRDYRRLKSILDETENSSRYSDAYISELKRKTAAIETAYAAAGTEVRELVERRFWKRRAYRDIDMPLSERTMQRYIRAFVIEVGKNLGEL